MRVLTRSSTSKWRIVCVNLPEEVNRLIEIEAKKRLLSKSDVIRIAIQKYIVEVYLRKKKSSEKSTITN